MAFYKLSSNGSKHYPLAVTVGQPVSTEQLAKELAEHCSMSEGDAFAMLATLSKLMHWHLAQGQSVNLKWLGSFMLKLHSKAVAAPEEFKFERDVTAVRVQFLPERQLSHDGRHYTRELVDLKKIEWFKLP